MTAEMYGRTMLDNDARWAAVLKHDARQDGAFVYGVTSTRIYCRPSCAARRPARKRVVFFDDAPSAECAGYRACRRCDPASKAAPVTQRVLAARAYLDAHPDETITLHRLAEVVGLTGPHLQRQFKRLVGLSPRAYARVRRLGRFKTQLHTERTVASATYAAGYGSSARAYADTQHLGMTPGAYRRGGDGMVIRYTVIPAPSGQMLVAATDRGLCAVTLGDDAARLETALHNEFPNAIVERNDPALAGWAREVMKLANENTAVSDVPLDIAGTAFQWRVWDLLRQIPRGETRSYTEIAAQLGQPSAVRAVARACASNHVALVIPCHRVVRSDGTLGGYRWGIERKRALLEQERAEG